MRITLLSLAFAVIVLIGVMVVPMPLSEGWYWALQALAYAVIFAAIGRLMALW